MVEEALVVNLDLGERDEAAVRHAHVREERAEAERVGRPKVVLARAERGPNPL